MNLFAIACVLLLEAERYVSAAPCFQQDIGTEANPATSCKNLLRFGQRTSAVYWIKPPGAKAPFQAYCDMKTEGGGWMLLYAYKHRGGDNFPLVRDLPTDPNGYSHQLLNAYGISLGWAQELRFFCSTSHHSRVVHFITRNRNIIQTAYDGKKHFGVSDWTDGFNAVSGHNGKLPAATLHIWTTKQATPGFTDFPFYKGGGQLAAHWGIAPFASRFECDDDTRPSNKNQNTLHRVWVRE